MVNRDRPRTCRSTRSKPESYCSYGVCMKGGEGLACCCCNVHKCDPSREKGPDENCESIDPDQPAQSAQADHGRNFSLFADFLCIK